MPDFERTQEMLQAVGHEIASIANNARENAMATMGMLAAATVLALGAAGKAKAETFPSHPADGGQTITGFGYDFKNTSLLAKSSTSEPTVTIGNTVEVDPVEVCTDLAVARPEDYRLKRVKRNGGTDTYVRPYMRLSTVQVDGTDCKDFGITRRASMYEAKNGRRNTPTLRVTGNDEGTFSRVFKRKRVYQCGQTVRGVVVVEADTDGKPGNDLRAVYRTRKGRIDCQ